MNIQALVLIVTVGLAFVGYLATYINNLLVSRRREKLELINKRINDFYGPLYVVSAVGSSAYQALILKIKREADKDLRKPLSKEEYDEWRLWVRNVFMPLNQWCEKLLIENAHLIIEREMPECILQFITHVSAYKVVIEKWSSGDFSEWDSIVDYPEDLTEYAAKTYLALKDEQLKLIRSLR